MVLTRTPFRIIFYLKASCGNHFEMPRDLCIYGSESRPFDLALLLAVATIRNGPEKSTVSSSWQREAASDQSVKLYPLPLELGSMSNWTI